MAGGGCGCGAVVRRRTGVAPREGGLSFPPDDVVCGWHILGDVLGGTDRQLGRRPWLVMETILALFPGGDGK